MKLMVTKQDESVICWLPDGDRVEVTMVSMQGDEITPEIDFVQAVRLLQQHTKLLTVAA